MKQEKLSVDRIDELMRIVFAELKRLGGRGRAKDVLAAVEQRAHLSEYELQHTRTNAIRWETHIRFYTTDCVKAGYLIKSSGYWNLTPQGEEALKLPKGQLIRLAQRSYRDWRKNRAQEELDDASEQAVENEATTRQTVYEKAVEDARSEIDQHLDGMNPYDFQKLVAELLLAMGYHVPYRADRGPDGGVDIVAYTDPLGTLTPRILVQVKHREQKVNVRDVRELEGLLRRDGDIGLFVSSGGFTNDVAKEIRASVKHIETMDGDRLIALWQQHYIKVREPAKSLLPLVQVAFLAPPEE
jgi:restriction system protein